MGTQNKLSDLNNHLFEQMERLNDDELTGEELSEAIDRSKAINNVARTILENARLVLNAQIHSDEYGYKERQKKMPKVFEIENKE